MSSQLGSLALTRQQWPSDQYVVLYFFTIVKDYVREHRRVSQEMFVPLSHPPGHAQCDFGEVLVIVGGLNRKPTASSSTCPTATGASLRHIPRRPPSVDAEVTCP